MSRGRPPKLACREAYARAAQRGMVLDAAGREASRFDFILFVRERVIFVRVKRSHSRISTIGQLSLQFSSEIAGLRKVPQIPVVSCELWILLPWGTWQYYGISDDAITEIDDDAMKASGLHRNPVLVPDQRDAISPGTAESRAGSDGQGSLFP